MPSTHRVDVRLSAVEHAALCRAARASQAPLADFVRTAALHTAALLEEGDLAASALGFLPPELAPDLENGLMRFGLRDAIRKIGWSPAAIAASIGIRENRLRDLVEGEVDIEPWEAEQLAGLLDCDAAAFRNVVKRPATLHSR